MKKLISSAAKLRKLLPKAYKITCEGMYVFVERDLHDCTWDHANDVVNSAIKKMKQLDEVGLGAGFGICEWHFVDKDIKKKLLTDTEKLHHAVATYFKTWKDDVCYSDDNVCDMFDSIRAMIDKNVYGMNNENE